MLILALTLSLFSCGASTPDSDETEALESSVEAAIGTDFDCLVYAKWEHFDEVIGENIRINFRENGRFSMHCDCGEPFMDFDLYDSFYHQKGSGIIRAYASYDENEFLDIELIFCDEYYLCVSFLDMVMTFKNANTAADEDFTDYEKQFINPRNDICVTILSCVEEDNTLLLAPYNYDADAKESFADKLYTVGVSEDVKVVEVYTYIENGETETTVNELDIDAVEEYNVAYLRFDDSGKVNSIVIYGKTIVYN